MESSQLEILLFTNTHFSSLLVCEKNDPDREKTTEYNRLEEACWNGFFKEAIPELYNGAGDSKKLTLWKVDTARHFLELEYGEWPQAKDPHLSVNPYYFLTEVLLS